MFDALPSKGALNHRVVGCANGCHKRPCAVPFLLVFLADHPSAYRTAGLRWETTTSKSPKAGTTSVQRVGCSRWTPYPDMLPDKLADATGYPLRPSYPAADPYQDQAVSRPSGVGQVRESVRTIETYSPCSAAVSSVYRQSRGGHLKNHPDLRRHL
jgi:hypothetical protein